MPLRNRIALAAAFLMAGAALAAPPKVVTAANSDPKCFAPWAPGTKLFQYPRRRGRTASHSPTATSPTPGASR